MSGTQRVYVVTFPNNDVDIHAITFNDKPLNVPGNGLADYVMNNVSDAELAYLKPFNDQEESGWYKKKEHVQKPYVSKNNVNKWKEIFMVH